MINVIGNIVNVQKKKYIISANVLYLLECESKLDNNWASFRMSFCMWYLLKGFYSSIMYKKNCIVIKRSC